MLREADRSKNPFRKLAQLDLSVLSNAESADLHKAVGDSYVLSIRKAIRHSKNPLEKLGEFDLEGLSEGQVTVLKEMVYSEQKSNSLPSLGDAEAVRRFVQNGKPEWLSIKDFAEFEQVNRAQVEWEKSFLSGTSMVNALKVFPRPFGIS